MDALKIGDFKVSYLNFESGRSTGKKFTFFNSLGTTKISRSLRLSVSTNAVRLINFPEQFESCFYFKYSTGYKVLYSR